MSTWTKSWDSISFLKIRSTIILRLLVICGILFLASSTSAGTTFTDRSAWNTAASAIGPITTEDFEGIPLQTFPDGTTPNLGVIPFDITLYGGPGDTGTQEITIYGTDRAMHLDIDADNVYQIDMQFNEQKLGFGADWFSTTTGDDLVVVTVGVNQYLFGNYLGYGTGDGFFGVIEQTPFTTLTFSSETLTTFGEDFFVDDFSVVVPEPGTLLLLGFGGLALLRKRSA